MKAATGIGIAVAAVGILLAAMMDGTSPAAFINMPALILIIAGTGGVTLASCGMDGVKKIPAGYKLVPGGTLPAMLDESSPVLRRAEAVKHSLWVTPYHPDERWPCGEFPTLAERDTGLPRWTAQNRPIENTDVVLWYVFGIHHITRPEDWPVMPCDSVSFWLKPFGFFDRNPALDVPPSGQHHGG